MKIELEKINGKYEGGTVTFDAVLMKAALERKDWPQVGDDVQILWDNGKVDIRPYDGGLYDQNLLKSGNIVHPDEDAEAIQRVRAAEGVIRIFCKNNGIEDRWREDDVNWYPSLETHIVAISLYQGIGKYPNFSHAFDVPTKQQAEQIIAACHDEVVTVIRRGGGCTGIYRTI